MKIAVAQTRSFTERIDHNIKNHLKIIERCADRVDMMVFPELSLTNYGVDLAEDSLFGKNDSRFENFQKFSDQKNTIIVLGAPIAEHHSVHISLVLFEPNRELTVYHKQWLHADEKVFFTEGNCQTYIRHKEEKIALAICYESLRPEHLLNVLNDEATLYVASVAKHQKGVEQADSYFRSVSKQYNLPILMANCVGPGDSFLSAGQSGVWNNGIQLEHLDDKGQGILFFDTDTNHAQRTAI